MLGGLIAAAGVVGVGGLAACGPGETPGGGGNGGGGNGGGGNGGKLVPPTYVPFEGVTPDLPGTADGVSAAFLKFPNPPVPRDGFPLPTTDNVTALLQGVPPGLAPDSNPAYEVFRASAGNKMDATTITSADYLNKFQTTMAGSEIPDFVQISEVPQYPKLLEKYFTDLTEVLGGDNVKKYPGLANIPPATWKIPVVNGRLWGISQPRPPAGLIVSTRGDLLKAKGIDKNPTVSNGQEFVELMTELTDAGKSQFAMGALPTSWLLGTVLEMMEAPNIWALEGDTFVSQLASTQMKDALTECGKIIKAGLLHPNSFSEPASNQNWWIAGTTALYRQGFTGWGVFARQYPSWDVGYVSLPKWDGGGKAPLFKSVAGYGAYIAIKKQASDARLEELLKLADFVASPFGTQEFLDVNYGKEGKTFKFSDGNPQYIEGQTANIVAGWPYLGGNSQNVLFTPGQDELTKAQHEYLSAAIPTGVDNAAQGLYSDTYVSKNATYAKTIADLQRGVMLGEKPMSEWDAFISKWKSEFGDKVAAEFAEAKAKS